MSSSVAAFSPGEDSCQIPEDNGEVCRSEASPPGLLDPGAGHLNKSAICRLVESDQVVEGDTDVTARTFSSFCPLQKFVLVREGSLGWQTSHPSSGRGRRRIWGIAASVTSCAGEFLGQILSKSPARTWRRRRWQGTGSLGFTGTSHVWPAWWIQWWDEWLRGSQQCSVSAQWCAWWDKIQLQSF